MKMATATRVLSLLTSSVIACATGHIGSINLDGAEIVSYHEASNMAFVIGGGTELYVVDVTTPTSASLVQTVALAGDSQSVSVNSAGLVAVAVGQKSVVAGTTVKFHANGVVQLFTLNATATQVLTSVANLTVGVLPDSLAFSSDGSQIVTANEGEPNDFYGTNVALGYGKDPEGTISIIDVDTANFPASAVTTLTFAAYNNQVTTLRSAGIRLSDVDGLDGIVGNLVSQDMEPEFVTVEGTTAYISAQENNAIIEVDLTAKSITSIKSAGLKNWDDTTLMVDTSDKDDCDGCPGHRPFEGVRMPDGIDTYTVGSDTYVVMANEGDGRVRPDDVNFVVSSALHLNGSSSGYLAIETAPTSSHTIVANLTDPVTGSQISVVSATSSTAGAEEVEDEDEFFLSAQFGWQADDDFYSDEKRLHKYTGLDNLPTWVQTNGASKSSKMGRLKTVETEVLNSTHPEKVVGFGGRSFSIMHSNGTIVYDSGHATEAAAIAAGIYDDGRSDDKGTEPEGVTLATRDNKVFAFVALERVNAVMVFDVTDPHAVSEVGLLNSYAPSNGRGPECVATSTADDLVIVANEAGTTGLVFYSLTAATTPPAPPTPPQTDTNVQASGSLRAGLVPALAAVTAMLIWN